MAATVNYIQVKQPNGVLSEKHKLGVDAENVVFTKDNKTLPQEMELKSDKTIYGDNYISQGRVSGSPVGNNSIAFGEEVQTRKENSSAFGKKTIASSSESIAIGRYNTLDEDEKYAFMIGNGEMVDEAPLRSDAFRVDWEGNVYAKDFVDLEGNNLISPLKSIQVGDTNFALHGSKLHLVAGQNISLTPSEILSENEGVNEHTLQVIITAGEGMSGDGSAASAANGDYLPIVGGALLGPLELDTDYDRSKFTDAQVNYFLKLIGRYEETDTMEERRQKAKNSVYTPLSVGNKESRHLNIDKSAIQALANKNIYSDLTLNPYGGDITFGSTIKWFPKKRSGGTGFTSKSIGSSSFGWGTNVAPGGQNSFAIGTGTRAGGSATFASGQNSVATGMAAHAEGINTQALGTAAHSEGSYTKAKGRYSHVGGYQSEANADYSYTFGNEVINDGEYSFAIGKNFNNTFAHSIVVGNDFNIVNNEEKRQVNSILAIDGSSTSTIDCNIVDSSISNTVLVTSQVGRIENANFDASFLSFNSTGYINTKESDSYIKNSLGIFTGLSPIDKQIQQSVAIGTNIKSDIWGSIVSGYNIFDNDFEECIVSGWQINNIIADQSIITGGEVFHSNSIYRSLIIGGGLQGISSSYMSIGVLGNTKVEGELYYSIVVENGDSIKGSVVQSIIVGTIGVEGQVTDSAITGAGLAMVGSIYCSSIHGQGTVIDSYFSFINGVGLKAQNIQYSLLVDEGGGEFKNLYGCAVLAEMYGSLIDDCRLSFIAGRGNITSASFSFIQGDISEVHGFSFGIAHGIVETNLNGSYSFVQGEHRGVQYPFLQSAHIEGYRNGGTSYSHTEGANNTVNEAAQYSHIEGKNNNVATPQSHIEGVSNTTDSYSDSLHVEGSVNNVTSSSTTHVEGTNNTVTGNYSHIEGCGHTVNASYSHIEGDSNNVSGEYIHAQGQSNTVSGNYATVVGKNNTVAGQSAVAAGENLIVNTDNQVAFGKYNKETDDLFVIGDGTSDTSRHNAMSVTKDGTVIAKKFMKTDGTPIGGGGELPIGTIITNDDPDYSGFDYGKWILIGAQKQIVYPIVNVDEYFNSNITLDDITPQEVITYMWQRVYNFIDPDENETYLEIANDIPEGTTFSISKVRVKQDETFSVKTNVNTIKEIEGGIE